MMLTHLSLYRCGNKSNRHAIPPVMDNDQRARELRLVLSSPKWNAHPWHSKPTPSDTKESL